MLNLRRRTIGVCVAILLGSVPFAFAGEAQWIEVRSPHFSVVTDAGEKRGRETVLKFEQMRSAFGAMLAKVNINTLGVFENGARATHPRTDEAILRTLEEAGIEFI